MAITTTTVKNTYSGDASTTVFSYTFRILDDDDIVVQLKNTSTGVVTTQTKTTHYTVTGVGNSGGGAITFITAPTATETVILKRNTTTTQEVDYAENDSFPAETHELALDKLTMIAQEHDDELGRALTLGADVTGFDSEVPDPTSSGNKYVKINSGGTAFEYDTISTSGLASIVEDTTPQLGGDLDTNGQNIQMSADTDYITDANGNELLEFGSTGSATCHFKLTNSTSTPVLSVAGTGGTQLVLDAGTPALYVLNSSATNPAKLKLKETNGADGVILQAPASLASDLTFTLPSADGSNGQVLQTNGSGTLSFVAQSGGGSDQVKEYHFPAEGVSVLETNSAPLEMITGPTNSVKTLVRAFDDTTVEYVNGKLVVPSDVDTSGTVTFRATIMAKTAAASKNVELEFEHIALANSEDYDGSYTAENSGDIAIDATQDDVTIATWTETVSNLGWAASDSVLWRLSRTAPSGNNLSGDMYLFTFTVEIPRA